MSEVTKNTVGSAVVAMACRLAAIAETVLRDIMVAPAPAPIPVRVRAKRSPRDR